MSGKRDESKGDDKKDVVDLVQEFCLSKNLERDFEDFAIEHSDVFMQAVEFKDDHGEHPLEFYEVYKKYLSKFEGKISDFIIDNGYTINEFYKTCQDILEDEEVFGTRRFFVETMLATSEYENFYTLMKSEMMINSQNQGSHK